MSAHPNAHILQRLAELAQITDKPWEHFEFQNTEGDWEVCRQWHSILIPNAILRERLFNPITINGKRLEGPMLEAPNPNISPPQTKTA